MAYPQGFLYQPAAPLTLYSCPPQYGARAQDLSSSSLSSSSSCTSGSAFAPYAGSAAAFSGSAAFSALQYGTEPAPLSALLGCPYEPGAGVGGSVGFPPFCSALSPFPALDPAYRKNATRDATTTLKAWLSEHRKNPYPTKGEKIMLAIITKMTLTQVSTWFANARRRLKKENKVTWCSKNEDDEEEENIELEKHEEDEETLEASETITEPGKEIGGLPVSPASITCESHTESPSAEEDGVKESCSSPQPTSPSHSPRPATPGQPPAQPPEPPPKPRLWSLAEMATSDKPYIRTHSPSSLPPPRSHHCPLPRVQHLYCAPSAFYPSFTNYSSALSHLRDPQSLRIQNALTAPTSTDTRTQPAFQHSRGMANVK